MLRGNSVAFPDAEVAWFAKPDVVHEAELGIYEGTFRLRGIYG